MDLMRELSENLNNLPYSNDNDSWNGSAHKKWLYLNVLIWCFGCVLCCAMCYAYNTAMPTLCCECQYLNCCGCNHNTRHHHHRQDCRHHNNNMYTKLYSVEIEIIIIMCNNRMILVLAESICKYYSRLSHPTPNTSRCIHTQSAATPLQLPYFRLLKSFTLYFLVIVGDADQIQRIIMYSMWAHSTA